MKLITVKDTILWQGPGITKRDTLKANTIVEDGGIEKNGYVYITGVWGATAFTSKPGYILKLDLRTFDSIPPPPPLPPAPLNLYRVKHGTERPTNDPLKANEGSFDISPLYVTWSRTKGDPVKLTQAHWDWERRHNWASPNWTLDRKTNWLIGPNGSNTMFWAFDDLTGYRIPVPGILGGNIVNVLSNPTAEAAGFAQIDVPYTVNPVQDYYPPYHHGMAYEIINNEPHLVRDGLDVVWWTDRPGFLPLEWLIKV